MCEAFEGMVDKAEDVYAVCIVAFCCDNDGGSQQGRKDLVLKRPWLFGGLRTAPPIPAGIQWNPVE